jgi:hypothetical protein
VGEGTWIRADGVASLEALRRWADDWCHCSDAARQVRILFGEWDAASRECEELRAALARPTTGETHDGDWGGVGG